MKKHRIVFNSAVPKKLETILGYISIESPTNAVEVVEGIIQQISSLSVMPERFPLIPEKITYKNYLVRHCFFKSFRIIYTLHKSTVRVLDVRHGAQNHLLKIH